MYFLCCYGFSSIAFNFTNEVKAVTAFDKFADLINNILCYFRLFSGGHSTFFGLLNTFVHIVMYSYYLFSALGQPFQKFLWWKKYLTALQMVNNFYRYFLIIYAQPINLNSICRK